MVPGTCEFTASLAANLPKLPKRHVGSHFGNFGKLATVKGVGDGQRTGHTTKRSFRAMSGSLRFMGGICTIQIIDAEPAK